MTAADKRILNTFLYSHIPPLYKELDSSHAYAEYDLMVCHEEVFDYSHSALHNKPIDKTSNFFGVPSAALCEDYIRFLTSVGQDHPDIQSFCQCQAAAVKVLLTQTSAADSSKKQLSLRKIFLIVIILAIIILASMMEFNPYAVSPQDYTLSSVKHTNDAIIISGFLLNSSKQVTGVSCEWDGNDIRIFVHASLILNTSNAPFDGIGEYRLIVPYRSKAINKNDTISIRMQGTSIFDLEKYEYTFSDQTLSKIHPRT